MNPNKDRRSRKKQIPPPPSDPPPALTQSTTDVVSSQLHLVNACQPTHNNNSNNINNDYSGHNNYQHIGGNSYGYSSYHNHVGSTSDDNNSSFQLGSIHFGVTMTSSGVVEQFGSQRNIRRHNDVNHDGRSERVLSDLKPKGFKHGYRKYDESAFGVSQNDNININDNNINNNNNEWIENSKKPKNKNDQLTSDYNRNNSKDYKYMKKKRYSTPVIAPITIARPLPPDPSGGNNGRFGNRGNSGNGGNSQRNVNNQNSSTRGFSQGDGLEPNINYTTYTNNSKSIDPTTGSHYNPNNSNNPSNPSNPNNENKNTNNKNNINDDYMNRNEDELEIEEEKSSIPRNAPRLTHHANSDQVISAPFFGHRNVNNTNTSKYDYSRGMNVAINRSKPHTARAGHGHGHGRNLVHSAEYDYGEMKQLLYSELNGISIGDRIEYLDDGHTWRNGKLIGKNGYNLTLYCWIDIKQRRKYHVKITNIIKKTLKHVQRAIKEEKQRQAEERQRRKKERKKRKYNNDSNNDSNDNINDNNNNNTITKNSKNKSKNYFNKKNGKNINNSKNSKNKPNIYLQHSTSNNSSDGNTTDENMRTTNKKHRRYSSVGIDTSFDYLLDDANSATNESFRVSKNKKDKKNGKSKNDSNIFGSKNKNESLNILEQDSSNLCRMFCPLKKSNLIFPRWIGINKPIWCNWSLAYVAHYRDGEYIIVYLQRTVFKIKYLKIYYKDIIFRNVETHHRRSRSQNRVNMNNMKNMNGMNGTNAQSLPNSARGYHKHNFPSSTKAYGNTFHRGQFSYNHNHNHSYNYNYNYNYNNTGGSEMEQVGGGSMRGAQSFESSIQGVRDIKQEYFIDKVLLSPRIDSLNVIYPFKKYYGNCYDYYHISKLIENIGSTIYKIFIPRDVLCIILSMVFGNYYFLETRPILYLCPPLQLLHCNKKRYQSSSSKKRKKHSSGDRYIINSNKTTPHGYNYNVNPFQSNINNFNNDSMINFNYNDNVNYAQKIFSKADIPPPPPGPPPSVAKHNYYINGSNENNDDQIEHDNVNANAGVHVNETQSEQKFQQDEFVIETPNASHLNFDLNQSPNTEPFDPHNGAFGYIDDDDNYNDNDNESKHGGGKAVDVASISKLFPNGNPLNPINTDSDTSNSRSNSDEFKITQPVKNVNKYIKANDNINNNNNSTLLKQNTQTKTTTTNTSKKVQLSRDTSVQSPTLSENEIEIDETRKLDEFVETSDLRSRMSVFSDSLKMGITSKISNSAFARAIRDHGASVLSMTETVNQAANKFRLTIGNGSFSPTRNAENTYKTKKNTMKIVPVINEKYQRLLHWQPAMMGFEFQPNKTLHIIGFEFDFIDNINDFKENFIGIFIGKHSIKQHESTDKQTRNEFKCFTKDDPYDNNCFEIDFIKTRIVYKDLNQQNRNYDDSDSDDNNNKNNNNKHNNNKNNNNKNNGSIDENLKQGDCLQVFFRKPLKLTRNNVYCVAIGNEYLHDSGIVSAWHDILYQGDNDNDNKNNNNNETGKENGNGNGNGNKSKDDNDNKDKDNYNYSLGESDGGRGHKDSILSSKISSLGSDVMESKNETKVRIGAFSKEIRYVRWYGVQFGMRRLTPYLRRISVNYFKPEWIPIVGLLTSSFWQPTLPPDDDVGVARPYHIE